MITEYIRYTIPPDKADDFHDAYRKASAALDAAPECLDYELTRGVEEPQNWILRVHWTSLEDHEQGFRSGPHFPPFFAEVKPFFGEIQEMKHYEVTDVVAGRPVGEPGSRPSDAEQHGASSPSAAERGRR